MSQPRKKKLSTKFSRSAVTAPSQTPKDVMALGRALVKELGLQPNDDTLSQWMAHHISELIIEAENNEGVAVDRCREAILALWNHVGVIPRGHRPIENIESLLVTIQALAPENQTYFYISEAQSIIDESTLSDQAKKFLELTFGIDHSARLLIGMCLKKVANEIAEEKQELLELAKALDVDLPSTRALRILIGNQEKSSEEQEAEVVRDAIKTLINRREKLREMVEMSESLAESIDEKIEKMEKSLKKLIDK